MKTLIKAAVAATLVAGLSASPALAANTASSQFTAKAKILKPLTLAKSTDLDFGTVAMLPLLTSSSVVVGRTGGATSSCGANLNCTGTQTAAAFNVTGVALQQLNVTLSNVPGGLIHSVDATKSVAFTVDPDTTVTLDNTGAGSFDIGGAITVLSSTLDGDYSNTVNVTVTYQ